MAIFKSLTFDGINSLDYGIYITGEAVYNAPERVVEMVSVPGRNGNIAIDQGRFENIEVTYHAGCFADSQADFADKVMRFRNALASRYTYKRLTDEYHPDEYRLGLYKSGLDVDAVRYGTAGEFDITFDCKPQRFLTSGETALTPSDYIDTQTATGEIVTIDSDGSLGVKSLEVSLDPIQDLHGYDKPWVGGAGKNKLPNTATSGTVANVTYTVNSDGTIIANGTSNGWNALTIGTVTLPSGTYWVTSGITSSDNYLEFVLNGSNVNTNSLSRRQFTLTQSTEITVKLYARPNKTATNLKLYPMIYLDSETDTTYSPYSNICPISERTEVKTIVSPTTSASDGTTYTTALGRTVYGGTLDVVSGELVVTDGYIASYNGELLPSTWISDRDVYASGTVPTTGAQVAYKLATPQTYQLTPQQIDLLLGTNHLWSDGEITVTYGTHPLYNPTQFESKPLIVVTGKGVLQIGDYVLTIVGRENQTIYIDCESQEAWEVVGAGRISRNDYIQNAGEEFPVLSAGANTVTLGSGITNVVITPRWWRL